MASNAIRAEIAKACWEAPPQTPTTRAQLCGELVKTDLSVFA